MLKVVSLVSKIHNYFINYSANSNEERLRIGVSLIAIYMWPTQIIYCFSIGLYIDSAICLAAFVFKIILLFLNKKQLLGLNISFHLMTLVTILAILGVNINAGMVVNPSLMFFCVIPMFAIPLCGLKWGSVWSIISILVSTLCMILAKVYNFSWNEFNPEQWYHVGLTNLTAGPILFLGLFGYFYFKNDILSKEIIDSNNNLSRANQQNEKILKVMTHDIGRNVALLSSNLELLMEEDTLAKEHESLLQYSSNIKKILLNSDILSYQNQSNFEIINVRSLINVIKLEFKDILVQKKIRLQIEEVSKFSVRVNKETFQVNVLGNLISNAIKFSAAKSIINITISKKEILIKNVNDQNEIKAKKGAGFGIPIAKEFLKPANLSLDFNQSDGFTYAKILKA